jgi:hypothetical protein
MPDRSIRGHRVRVTVLVLLSLLMASLFAVVARQSWTGTSADSQLATDEQQRLAYLGPLAHLVGALTETQSAVVRGAPMDTNAVQSAVSGVADVDNRYRGNLGTGQLWDDLREKITRAITQPGTGQAGYQTFADILSLSLDLVQRVGDTSDLIRDSKLDSYYILDTALLQLPQAVVAAGRAADLALLTGKSTLSGASAIAVAVARYDVAQEASEADNSITRSIEATNRSALGADLADELDGFRAAVDQFAPAVILNQLTDPIDADSLPPAAGAVRVAALALGDVVVSELQALLAQRVASLDNQRQLILVASVVVLLALIGALWLVLALPRGRPSTVPPSREHERGTEEVSVAHAAEQVPADLIDLRHLLDFDEVEFRKAVRARQPGSGDHAG